MLITDILKENADLYRDKPALVERIPEKGTRREITWKTFDEQANRLAHTLMELGVSKGDKVIQLMSNCMEWLPVYFGILRTGAWVVPLNFRFDSDKIALCTETAEAKVMIFGEEFIERIAQIKERLDRHVTVYIFDGPDDKLPEYAQPLDTILSQGPCHDPGMSLIPDDDAALYFTSGTTGTPKAVRLTHRNLASACDVEHAHHGQTHQDNFLCIPPLYHTGAKMHWFGNFLVGAKSVILKGVSPRWILEAVSEEQVSIVWLLVPWAHDILIAIENGEVNLKDYTLGQWRLMHIGAQPVPPSLIEKWKKVFPDQDYDTNYGLTEATGPGCIHLGMGNEHKVGAIGLPGKGWECQVVDGDLNPLPGGETGELLLKGPGVMKEYYKNPEETSKALVNGWLRTGDMARKDESEFIWLVDRKKDLIITGGENIFPVEIENFFMTHDHIQDVAVIGVPDPRLGEVVAAVIQVKAGRRMDREDVMTFAQGLPRYKRPRTIIFDDVPRNPTGKIEKPKLRRKYIRGDKDFRKLFV
ncbi:MAG: AMP-binding protein [Proteobacteria bacterium]|nr:AMP-binding protein [Pseudomonadota bacterium]